MKSMIINNNKISIDFKDTDYAKGLGVSVQNAREGSISNIGIEYTTDCAVRKDMGNSIVYTDTNSTNSILQEAAQGLSGDTFDPAEFISQSMNGKDAKTIEDEDGSILEEYVASSLERALERVKTQRRENAEAVEQQVEKSEDKKEFMDEIDRRIKEAAQMAAGLQGMSEAAAKYLLENELPVTPANVKGSLAAGAAAGGAGPIEGKEPFETVRSQAEAILKNSGLEVNEENMAAAEKLYEEGAPVTAENIRSYQAVQDLKELSPEMLEARIEDEVLEGILPEEADLANISRKEAAERLEKLVQTDEETLRHMFATDAEVITAKRQLEEIRLTMTIDAARRMENKGIHLDVQNLVQIVDELKQMEQEACRGYLQSSGVEQSKENVEIMTDTLRAREDILSAPAAVYGRTIETVHIDTIADVAAAGREMRLRMESSYESVGTEVRADLGDRISKAFSNVNDILEDLQLEPTAMNQRAVRILGYNRMELTRENILSMKEYDDKVTTLVRELRPQVVAELIRRKENPLEMSLDELGEKVSQISEELTQDDVSFRKYLWKLDHSGGISEEERKSMIGIYRLLDKVNKSDGAVIGQVVRDGRELSFSSLLSAIRTRKSKGIDREVDDDFGGLKEVVSKGESISDQISAAFGSSVVSKLQKELSPAVLKDRNESYMSDPLELLLDECQGSKEAAKETAEYYEQRAEELRHMASESDEQILHILRQIELPDSLMNTHLMRAYLEQGSKEYLKFFTREGSEEIIEAFDDPQLLSEVYEEKENEIADHLREQKDGEDITSDTVKEIAVMAGSISFYRQMRRFQKYEVPIVTERGVTACAVTVRQGDKAEKGTVEISVSSSRFGDLQATFKVAGTRVSGFVTSEEEGTLEVSRSIFGEFETDLEMNGFTMERGDFAKGTRNSFHSGSQIEEEATNDRLYLVAKLFIQNVQRREDEK